MKIFLSYGHDDNTPMVERIRMDLAARGHEVWIDTAEIKSGDDWRRSIAQGVQNSQKILAILSKHSVREPGVCLDELAIALANGCEQSLVTVLLERVEEVQPPLLVGHIQWVDFHDWRIRQSEGQEVFDAWYTLAFSQLIVALESQKNYEGEIDALRRLLHISDKQCVWVKKAARYLEHGFVGREWLESEISAWLHEEISSSQEQEAWRKIFCLTAGHGAGKSALVANFTLRNRHHVAGLHFCEETDSAQEVLLSLAFQLGTRLPDYRSFLLASLRELPADKYLQDFSPDELFDFLLRKAAHMTVDGGRNRYTLVLDGLEKSDGSLARLFTQKATALPRWLRVIVTSSPDAAHINSHLASIPSHSLDINDPRNQADAQAWIDTWLAELNLPAKQKALCASTLFRLSGGLFAYLVAFRDSVEQNPALLEKPQAYPDDLLSYACYLPDLEVYNKELRPFLGLLCAACGPLSLYEAERTLRKQNKELDRGVLQEDILPRLSSLLIVQNNTVQPFHKSFITWLQSERSGSYRINISNEAAGIQA